MKHFFLGAVLLQPYRKMPWLDLTPYISANTEIRFGISSGFADSGENLFLDNLRIDVNCLCDGIADAGIDLEICDGENINLMGSGGESYVWSPAGSLSNPTIADPIASPTSTTTYTLTVTDEYGCTDTDQVTVMVNENLDASVLVVAHDYCEDGSGVASLTILNGEGPFTINWQTPSGTEQGTTTIDDPGTISLNSLNGGTTYCIQVTDNNGCTVSTP